jgi:molybdopterin-synthase adenylyltransferase
VDRYERQIRIDGFGQKGQERLLESNVFIAGTGGLGSLLAMYLAVAGVGRITLLDRDRVDITNLNRQLLHWEEDLGRHKVDSAKNKLTRMNSGVQIQTLQKNMDESNAENLIAGHDLVLDALDNLKTRKTLNQACLKLKLPFVFGGVSRFSGMVSVFAPGQTACLACVFPNDSPDVTHPILGATAGVIASLQATEAVKILTGLGKPLYDRLLIYDGLTMNVRTINVKRNKTCPVCADT